MFAADQVHAVLGTFSIPAILCELFVFLGGVGMYAELVVRSALISIVVFRGPLTRLAADSADLERRVRHVVRHEVAHYFGISDERLREIDAY